ncbi:hypothetical protein V6x_51600 [Gimesia chilikensis]|uniref:Uncharacterized protein n=1 Tax=Gimesia chilikensis TaxID=2605989 RepID=A0A517WJM2_9PLAN|nr:hypothetical protein [Gimesia chilikensis]QDU05423.1 hypothetical protein V6x_51600 [Gimesia chilikensis]
MDIVRVLNVVNDTSDYLGVDGNGVISGLLEGFFGEEFLKELFTVLGEISPILTKSFGNAAGEVSPEIADAIKQVLNTISENLSFAIKNLQDLPGPFSKGAVDAFEKLRLLGEIANCINLDLEVGSHTFDISYYDFIQAKINIVVNSITELNMAVHGTDESEGFLLHSIFGSLEELFKQALDPEGTNLVELLGSTLITNFLSTELIEHLLDAAIERKSWFWTDLPGGKITGVLHYWINHPESYGLESDNGFCCDPNSSKSWNLALEREYRLRLVAAYDAYFAQRLNGEIEDSLSNADQRVSFEILGDIISIFFEQTTKFVLETNCSPQIDLELPGFDDIGFKLARFSAPQLYVPIKGLIGIIFRGVSFLSINNSAFIELIASIVARFFSSIIEGVIVSLSSIIRVVGAYGPITPPRIEGEIYRWSTMEAIEGNVCVATDRLMYIAVIRHPNLLFSEDCYITLSNNSLIKDFAKDIGAYLDMCYLTYTNAPRFFTMNALDEVTIIRAEYAHGRLLLLATTNHTVDEYQPILRAYFCCHMVAMRPSSTPFAPYKIDIPIKSLPNNAQVKIVSNLGGTATCQIFRV